MNLSKTNCNNNTNYEEDSDSDSNSQRGTYFYNIQKNDENVIDEYKIYYKYKSDTQYLLMIYEESIVKYINENIYTNQNFISSDSYLLFECEEIQFKILITNLDDNNLHVIVILINLSNSIDNQYYWDFYHKIEQLKIEIIENNKLLNSY